MPSDSESSSSLSSLGECCAHGGIQVSGEEMSKKEHYLPWKKKTSACKGTNLRTDSADSFLLNNSQTLVACLHSEHMQVITQM